MYPNAKLFVAPMAIVILTLCVLSTNQTLFSRKKPSMSPTADSAHQSTGAIPQKETSHWWQIKHRPEPTETSAASAASAGTNQVTVAVPFTNIHQKLQSILESHKNSDVKWVPCLCPIRKSEQQQQQQQHHHQQQGQHQQQQQEQQQQQQQPHSSYYPQETTQDPPGVINSAPRLIITNYQLEQ